ncbi:MAG TPA: hypothetical protein VF174_07735 [Micromonosporaceae bacterium]
MVFATVVVLLFAVGVLPRWPGLGHLVALPPLDLITDLRILMVEAPSYPAFLAGVLVSLAVRVTVLAFLLGGPSRQSLAYAARYYLIMLGPAAVAAGLLLASKATLYFGLFWIGLLATVVVVVLAAPAVWAAPPRLARGFADAFRHGQRSGTVGAYLVVLAGLGALADWAGALGTVLFVPASAGLTLVAARALRADPGLRALRRTLAAGGAVLAAALVVIVAVGPAGPPRAPEPDAPRAGSLLLMSGVDSSSGSGAMLELDPHNLGYTCAQTRYFSYAGPGDGQPRGRALCPITTGAPYQARDTLRPTAQLIDFLEAQLADMPPPVVLVTHSQGVWVTWQAAVRRRLPNVAVLVLVGPFPDNPVPYPPQGEQGRSRVAATVTALVSRGARPGGTSAFTPDSPLGREWLADPYAVEETLAHPLPEDIRALAVPSVFDLPLMPDGPALRTASDLCPVPVIHPNLPYSAEFQRALAVFLDGRTPDSCPFWRPLVGHVFRPFTVAAWDD